MAAEGWDPGKELKTYLHLRYPWQEIEVSEPAPEGVLPKERPKKINLISGPLGRAVFSLEFRSGERVLVRARIRALDWTVFSRRPLKNGQVIEKDDVYLALMDVQRLPREALTDLESAWGKLVKRSIGTNMPLTDGLLSHVPVIKKGQRVTLIVSAPGLKITAPGEAREDGQPGQQIKVVNLISRRDIRGVPVDDQYVKVMF
jgi:flagella basal body P-ring formation protein FlgA